MAHQHWSVSTNVLSRKSIKGRSTISASMAALFLFVDALPFPLIWFNSTLICFTQSSIMIWKLETEETWIRLLDFFSCATKWDALSNTKEVKEASYKDFYHCLFIYFFLHLEYCFFTCPCTDVSPSARFFHSILWCWLPALLFCFTKLLWVKTNADHFFFCLCF